jgi:hypothetical protein
MGTASNTVAILGLCLLAAQTRARDHAPLEILVFSAQATVPDPMPRHESLTLQVDIAPQAALPPQLTLYQIAPPAPHAIDGLSKSGSGAVVGVYQKMGPRVLAADVPGSTPAIEISGKDRRHYELVVLSNPSAGSDRAYNDWYDHQHVPDVLRVPGFAAAQRLKLVSDKTPATYSLPSYAVRFDFDSYDLQATMADVRHRLVTGITRSSTAFDMKSSVTRYYEITEAKP